jgi:UDP-N-acetylmuramoyl-L-alanyl-D-glutamate--2,6-diaminopimelate ligase
MTPHPLEVRLHELARAAADDFLEIRGDADQKVTGLAYDSRAVTPGTLFFCVPGLRSDGHAFASQAAAAGASALCVERPLEVEVPQLVVRDVRRSMPLIAARALGNPADELLLLGVTGTNGKTTTAFLIESILRADQRTTGLIGTIETRVAGRRRPGVRTTPESLDLQSLFRDMRSAGVDSAAMEVTSHALVLNRVDGFRFAAAAFTNLTQDHLDFHSSMEDYFEAKRSLFTPERAEKGAANVDDPYGQKIVAEASIPMLGFGTIPAAETRAERIEMTPTGSRFHMTSPKGAIDITTTLPGPFNISNCLAAAAVSLQSGIGLEAIEAGIADLQAVPGRFEAVGRGQPFAVIVDYAHTPDSLENILVAARRMAAPSDGSLVCVFGCGGDRDRAKRPLMGAAVARLADRVIVTSDNPRSEEPAAILDEIVEGVIATRAQGPDVVEVDRRVAIETAITEAREGDVVVIAGKGHETGQEFADRTVPFDDREVAAEVLAGQGWVADR